MASLRDAVVRLWRGQSYPVGAGTLVGARTFLTCTHVVNDALGRRRGTTPDEGVEVDVDFLVEPGRRITAVLIFCTPVDDGIAGDIAVLELSDDPPFGVRPAVLVETTDLWERRCRMLGFPRDNEDGLYAAGILHDLDDMGWRQIGDDSDVVRPGFSGSPVWVEEFGGVVGMVVARRDELAMAIPVADLMRVWPPLATMARPPSPFRGLGAFAAGDSAVFFGRNQEVTQLLELAEQEAVIAVVGPSGVGKSSLILAGVLPRLIEAGAVAFTARVGAMTSLDALVREATCDAVGMTSAAKAAVREWLRCSAGGAATPADFRVVLVLDQVDEGLAADLPALPDLDRWLSGFGRGSGSDDLAVTVFATLRDDFLLEAQRRMPALWESWNRLRFSVRPMGRAQLETIVAAPVAGTGVVRLEQGLAQRIACRCAAGARGPRVGRARLDGAVGPTTGRTADVRGL